MKCKTYPRLVRLVFPFIAAGLTAQAQNAASKILIGDTKVTVIHSYQEPARLPKPAQAVVLKFDIPSNVITLDHSPMAHIMSHDPVAKMKHDEGRNESPADVAQNVQAAFVKTLAKELEKVSLPTVAGTQDDIPSNAIIIRGGFTDVNLGNKTKRMIIGFGRGASDVKAHVMVSLNATNGPILLSEFDLTSVSGKKPGAAATMGVGSAAASAGVAAATDGKATVEGDASRMAKAVSKQVQSIMAAQHWISPISNDGDPK
jgi:hypothetical protein